MVQASMSSLGYINRLGMRMYHCPDGIPTTYYAKIVEQQRREETNIPTQADMVGSQMQDGSHMPIFDIDYAATLVPSGTPGHCHLILERPISKRKYTKVLRAMYRAGLMERNFYLGMKVRGQTFLRVPWKPKNG